MSINFNANSISKSWAGVDVQNVKQISEQILQRAQQKTVDLNQIDLTKFNRPTQGVDLYNPKVSLDTQKYIAMQNAGLIGQVNNSALTQLNAQAATNLYSANANPKIQGNMTISVAEGNAEKNIDVFPVYSPVEVFKTSNLAKDKRGSNSFMYQQSGFENEDNNENLDIQA